MQKIKQHIEIVRTTIPGMSSLSTQSALAIQVSLRQTYDKVGITTVQSLADLILLAAKKPDLVFMGVKYIPLSTNSHKKIWISEFLEKKSIACIGSEHAAHILELDKSLAKAKAQTAGLQTSRFIVSKRGSMVSAKDISFKYPVFIKPTDKGGGLGIDIHSVACNYKQVVSKVTQITERFQTDALIEEFLPGREFSVAILKKETGNKYYCMPLELIAPLNIQGNRILSAEVKSADTETFKPLLDTILRTKVCELALGVFNAIGARDYGRIDIRLDAHGEPQFLEANLIPSIIEDYGNFPKACMLNLGMSYKAMLLHIVRLGMARKYHAEEVMLAVLNTPFLTP